MNAIDLSSKLPKAVRPTDCSTVEAAAILGLSVRSVQFMVDRGELPAWKTPGGHQRISRAALEHWRQKRETGRVPVTDSRVRVLLIEDSLHFQSLVSLLLAERLPGVALEVADDGITGLTMTATQAPDVLLVDLLLPGVPGATLIEAMRQHPRFKHIPVIVLTSLDEPDLAPFEAALAGLPVVSKARLTRELLGHLQHALSERAAA